jgi:hypothetical protein
LFHTKNCFRPVKLSARCAASICSHSIRAVSTCSGALPPLCLRFRCCLPIVFRPLASTCQSAPDLVFGIQSVINKLISLCLHFTASNHTCHFASTTRPLSKTTFGDGACVSTQPDPHFESTLVPCSLSLSLTLCYCFHCSFSTTTPSLAPLPRPLFAAITRFLLTTRRARLFISVNPSRAS